PGPARHAAGAARLAAPTLPCTKDVRTRRRVHPSPPLSFVEQGQRGSDTNTYAGPPTDFRRRKTDILSMRRPAARGPAPLFRSVRSRLTPPRGSGYNTRALLSAGTERTGPLP